MAGVEARHRFESFDVGVHDVMTRCAVHMHVDDTWEQDAALRIDDFTLGGSDLAGSP